MLIIGAEQHSDVLPATPRATGPFLGCPASDYTAQVVERCRAADESGSGVPVATLTEFDNLEWGRVLDDVSKATIRLPASCCGQLADVAEWRHELVVYRRGAPMWQGPITFIDPRSDHALLIAWDLWGWLARRVIHENLRFQDGFLGRMPPTEIAKELAADGFRGPLGFEDDPCGSQSTQVFVPNDYDIGRRYRANSQYSLSAIRQLAEKHIDFTSVGRQLVIVAKGASLGRTALLTDEHFGGPVSTPSNGTGTATRVYFRGDGVHAEAGGVHDFFGLLEVIVEDTAVDTKRDAIDTAMDLVGALRPPLQYVEIPQGSALSPEAPLTIDELVPGVTVPVVVESTCRTVAADMQLSKVDVTVTPSAGEAIKVGMVAPRSENPAISGLEDVT